MSLLMKPHEIDILLKSVLTNNSSIQKLELDKVQLKSDQLKTIARLIRERKIPKLQELVLKGVGSNEGVYDILSCLTVPECGILELDLSFVRLNPLQVSFLARCLKETVYLSNLKLNCCGLQSDGLRQIFECLQQNRDLYLKNLELEKNSICENFSQPFSNYLEFAQRRKKDLLDIETRLNSPTRSRSPLSSSPHNYNIQFCHKIERLSLAGNKLFSAFQLSLRQPERVSMDFIELNFSGSNILKSMDYTKGRAPIKFNLFKNLCNVLAHNQRIEVLKLSNIGMAPSDMQYLASVVRQCKSLTFLDISQNCIKNDGVCTLLADIHKSNLRSIDLSNNYIQDSGFVGTIHCLLPSRCFMLTAGKLSVPKLRELNFSGNLLTFQTDFTYLQNYFKEVIAEDEPFMPLRVLDLSSQKKMKLDALKQLLVLLNKYNSEGSLILKLANVKAVANGIEFVAQFIELTSGLQEIHLEDNGLSDLECALLLQAFAKNLSVMRINLSGNQFGEKVRSVLLSTNQQISIKEIIYGGSKVKLSVALEWINSLPVQRSHKISMNSLKLIKGVKKTNPITSLFTAGQNTSLSDRLWKRMGTLVARQSGNMEFQISNSTMTSLDFSNFVYTFCEIRHSRITSNQLNIVPFQPVSENINLVERAEQQIREEEEIKQRAIKPASITSVTHMVQSNTTSHFASPSDDLPPPLPPRQPGDSHALLDSSSFSEEQNRYNRHSVSAQEVARTLVTFSPQAETGGMQESYSRQNHTQRAVSANPLVPLQETRPDMMLRGVVPQYAPILYTDPAHTMTQEFTREAGRMRLINNEYLAQQLPTPPSPHLSPLCLPRQQRARSTSQSMLSPRGNQGAGLNLQQQSDLQEMRNLLLGGQSQTQANPNDSLIKSCHSYNNKQEVYIVNSLRMLVLKNGLLTQQSIDQLKEYANYKIEHDFNDSKVIKHKLPHPRPKYILISNLEAQEPYIKKLVFELKMRKNVRTVVFDKLQVHQDSLPLLTFILKDNFSLKGIAFSNCKMNSRAISMLLEAMEDPSKALLYLGLDGCQLESVASVKIGASLMLLNPLRVINLSNNNLQDIGCLTLVNNLSSESTLQQLILQKNNLTARGSCKILSTLASVKSELRFLDLQLNSLITQEFVKSLKSYSLLASKPSLIISASLSQIQSDIRTFKHLASCLSSLSIFIRIVDQHAQDALFPFYLTAQQQVESDISPMTQLRAHTGASNKIWQNSSYLSIWLYEYEMQQPNEKSSFAEFIKQRLINTYMNGNKHFLQTLSSMAMPIEQSLEINESKISFSSEVKNMNMPMQSQFSGLQDILEGPGLRKERLSSKSAKIKNVKIPSFFSPSAETKLFPQKSDGPETFRQHTPPSQLEVKAELKAYFPKAPSSFGDEEEDDDDDEDFTSALGREPTHLSHKPSSFGQEEHLDKVANESFL